MVLVMQRSVKVRGSAGRNHRVLFKPTPPIKLRWAYDRQDKNLRTPVLRSARYVLRHVLRSDLRRVFHVIHMSLKG